MKPGEYLLEGLLRPPIELYSAAVSAGVALVALVAPWALMMPWYLGLALALAAGGFALVRTHQALEVIRYQHGMRYYKVTRLAPSKVPVPADQLYLGEGFQWTQQHTQRKYDAIQPSAKPYVTPGHLGQSLRALGNHAIGAVVAAEDIGGKASWRDRMLAAVARNESWFNPLHPYADLGGTPILHGVGGMEEAPVALRQSARTGHMLVMGTTRVGKTRLLEMLATQDIHAGKTVIVIDPKGDADLMLRMYAEATRVGRRDRFYLFHLGYPEISARYNGIGNFARVTEVATRATNALPSSGNSAAFKEFSWRFSNIVAQAQVALGRVPTYESLLRDVTGIDSLFMDYSVMAFSNLATQGVHPDWEQKVAEIQEKVVARKAPVPRSLSDRKPEFIAMFLWIKEAAVQDKVLSGLAAAFSYERSFYEKIIASLGPFLEKLTTGAVGQLISPDYFDLTDKRPIFDWLTVMRQNAIVYVGLDALSDAVVSSAVGNSMLADLVSVGGKLYKTGLNPNDPSGKVVMPNVCCHFDEVNEIAGPEFVPMVNKLGGAGFRITAYTQSMFDIEAKVGDKAKAGQIHDNFNHLVMLRVRSVTTANLLAEQVPQVDVATVTPMSGATDTSVVGTGVAFTSRNDDIITKTKVPMIEASDILELPQGQAFALLEGNRRYKIRIPLPETKGDQFIPESLKKVAAEMKQRYRTSEQWARETDWLTLPAGGLMDTTPVGAAALDLAASLDAGLIDTQLAEHYQAPHNPAEDQAEAEAEADSAGNAVKNTAVLGQIVGGH